MDKSIYSNDRYKFSMICIYISELFILFSLQQVPGFLPEIYGGRPILILPLMFVVSLAEGNYLSMIWGLITGLILDLSLSRFIGIQVIILGIAGYFLGRLRNKLLEINFCTFLIITLFMEPILIFARFYLIYMTRGLSDIDIAIYNHVIPCIVYTLVLSPIIYLFNRSISFFVRKKGGV